VLQCDTQKLADRVDPGQRSNVFWSEADIERTATIEQDL
jgi:hypothetical protein